MASSSAGVFEWGDREPGTSSSYESMLYRGVRYRLHDCVFINSGLPNPYVGKLMRLYEDEQGVKKIRARWFFRPYELPIHVSTDARNVATTKELFIAIGPAKGVENENEVGVIRGKANVLCTARFPINPMPPQALIDAADHVFNRAYDVVRKKLVKLANVDNKVLAQKFMNKLEWVQPPQNEHVRNQASTSAQVQNQASTSAQVQNQASTSAQVQNQASTSAQVQNQASTSAQVQNQASTSAQFRNQASTSAQFRNQASTSAQIQYRASTSEGSTSYTTSKDVHLVRRKKTFVSIPERIGTKVKKLKKF